jgi:hypothetical protein
MTHNMSSTTACPLPNSGRSFISLSDASATRR